jgi:hypothetical protein
VANFIQSAIKRPGALTKKAKRSGKSPMAFARAHKGSKGLTGQQSRLAIQLAGFARKGAFKKGKKRG